MIERKGEPLHGRMIPHNMILARGKRQPKLTHWLMPPEVRMQMSLRVGFPRLSSFGSCMLWEDEAIQWVDHEGSSHAESLRGSCPMGRMGRVFPGGLPEWLWIVSLSVTCRQKFSQFGKQKIPRSRTQQIQYLAVTLHFPAFVVVINVTEGRKARKQRLDSLPQVFL